MQQSDFVRDQTQATHITARIALDVNSTFRLLVDQITDYAIFLLTPTGEVATWNPGAQRIKGFAPGDIIGKHFRNFYPPEEQIAQKPEYELRVAAATGRFEDEGWRVRKDGSRFWANVIITAIRGPNGDLLGFGKVTRDLTERKSAEEQLRKLSQTVMKAQDEERGRLARELHDAIGQYLAALNMTLQGALAAEHLDQEQLRKNLSECIPLVEQAITEVRTLSYLLYPPMLDEMGLSAAIRWHLTGFSRRSGIAVTHQIADVRLPRDVELAFFRLLQESLANVHRHSESRTAQIRFAMENGEAVLEIRDQGKGMPAGWESVPLDLVGTLGVGIRGMHERVRQLGGTLELKSNGGGTTVRARVPVPDLAKQDLTEQGSAAEKQDDGTI